MTIPRLDAAQPMPESLRGALAAHVEVLRHSGFADLQAGEAVGLRIVEGKRGRMAVQVLSWESSARAAEGAHV